MYGVRSITEYLLTYTAVFEDGYRTVTIFSPVDTNGYLTEQLQVVLTVTPRLETSLLCTENPNSIIRCQRGLKTAVPKRSVTLDVQGGNLPSRVPPALAQSDRHNALSQRSHAVTTGGHPGALPIPSFLGATGRAGLFPTRSRVGAMLCGVYRISVLFKYSNNQSPFLPSDLLFFLSVHTWAGGQNQIA